MNPRASRIAVIVASVPVETSLSLSTIGTRARTASARRVSAGVDAPKESPRAAATCTAATTEG